RMVNPEPRTGPRRTSTCRQPRDDLLITFGRRWRGVLEVDHWGGIIFMTDEELVTKAVEWLQRFESKMPDRLHGVTADRLPKRRIRDAVVIDFTSDEDRGSIRVVMERETGDLIESSHSPPRATESR